MIGGPDFVSRLFNTPVGLREASRDVAVGMLASWTAGMRSGELKALGSASGDNVWRPYDVVAGVAIIPIQGVLIQSVGDWWWLAEMMGSTGYDYIRMMFLQALDDDSVDAIVLSVNSPGGDVAGCFDLADTIFESRGRKPIWAILAECAYSAAYALASAADKIVVPRTGGTGSVGIILMHVSIEEAMKKAGFDVTLIKKGAKKGDFSEFFPLTEEALASALADVETVGVLFDQTVARNRGMKVEDVTATEAGCFLGAAGVAVGFADAVMSPDAAFRALLAELG